MWFFGNASLGLRGSGNLIPRGLAACKILASTTSHPVPLEKYHACHMRRGTVLTGRISPSPLRAQRGFALVSHAAQQLLVSSNFGQPPPTPVDAASIASARSTRQARLRCVGQPWAPQARPRAPSCWAPARRATTGGRDRPNRLGHTTQHPRSRRLLVERPAPPRSSDELIERVQQCASSEARWATTRTRRRPSP